MCVSVVCLHAVVVFVTSRAEEEPMEEEAAL